MELSAWEGRLRDALKKGDLSICGDVNVVNCPILDAKLNVHRYDIILSSLCLEDACLTLDTYKATIKRLSLLLKPGGFILLTHGRNQSFYTVVDKSFFALPINERDVRDALEQANFTDIHVKSAAKPRDNFADADGFLIAYAFTK